METISPLLGQPPEREFVEKIEQIVLSQEGIIGMHDLVVHDYGPGRVMVSLHAEVPADGNLIHLHDTVDNTEKLLNRACGCEAVIHMDPIAVHDVETIRLHDEVVSLLHTLDSKLSLHDFRVVNGPTHTNLVFDVVVPFGFRLSDEEVLKSVSERVHELEGTCYAVIQIDKSSIKPD
jgi:Co/Zn/Cd efflux system component